jgi:uncharacterized protein YjbJ (UPF0337 family)
LADLRADQHAKAQQHRPAHPSKNLGTSGELRRSGSVSEIKDGEIVMDWNRVEGNWKQIKGKVKEQWGKLTDDDLDQINGKREQLEGKIQERYGYAKDQAKKDVDDWYGNQRFH